MGSVSLWSVSESDKVVTTGLVEIELWVYGRQELPWNRVHLQEQVGRRFVWNGKIGVVVCGVVWWRNDLLNSVHEGIAVKCRRRPCQWQGEIE